MGQGQTQHLFLKIGLSTNIAASLIVMFSRHMVYLCILASLVTKCLICKHLILQQEDIRNFIDSSLKRGYELPVFRKERIGGDSYGISYWCATANFWYNYAIKFKNIFLWPGASLINWCATGMTRIPSLDIGYIVRLGKWSMWRTQPKKLKGRESQMPQLYPINGRLLHATLLNLN